MIGDIVIQTRREGSKYLTHVLKVTGSDQREGDHHEVVAVALGRTPEEAAQDAVREAFDL